MTSPVRLRVSPAAVPTPTGAFNQRSEALFPPRWSPGLCILLRSPHSYRFIYAQMQDRGVLPAALPAPFSATLNPTLSVYLCTNVGPQGLLVVRLPAPFVPHSASLGPATATRVLSTPVPISAPPTGLDECFFFIYLVLDFLAIGFSVSSGCARRRNVSTYTAILVLPDVCMFSLKLFCQTGQERDQRDGQRPLTDTLE